MRACLNWLCRKKRKSPLGLERLPVCKGVGEWKPRKPQGALRKEVRAGGVPPARWRETAGRGRGALGRRLEGLLRFASRFARNPFRGGFARGGKTLGVSLCLAGPA